MSDLLDFGPTRIIKVISGGQTGADQGGLEGAMTYSILSKHKVSTGGTAPKNFRTEP